MLIRNAKVASFYHGLIQIVSKRNQMSIRANKPWQWRYNEMPDQLKMIFYFWRPYDLFYDKERLLGPDPNDVPQDIYDKEEEDTID